MSTALGNFCVRSLLGVAFHFLEVKPLSVKAEKESSDFSTFALNVSLSYIPGDVDEPT